MEFKIGIFAVLGGDFESGAEHPKHVVALMEEDKDSGPFTAIGATISCILLAVIENDYRRMGFAMEPITRLDRSIPMRNEEKMALMVPMLCMTDVDNKSLKPLTREDIIGITEGLDMFPVHEYTWSDACIICFWKIVNFYNNPSGKL